MHLYTQTRACACVCFCVCVIVCVCVCVCAICIILVGYPEMFVNVGIITMRRHMNHDKKIYICNRKSGKMFKLALIGSGRDNEYFIYGRVDNFQDVPVLLSILELDDYLDIYSDDDCTQTRQKR